MWDREIPPKFCKENTERIPEIYELCNTPLYRLKLWALNQYTDSLPVEDLGLV
jgi:hypothetical protein